MINANKFVIIGIEVSWLSTDRRARQWYDDRRHGRRKLHHLLKGLFTEFRIREGHDSMINNNGWFHHVV